MAKTALATMDDLRELVRGNALPEIEDPEQVKLAIIDQVLSASTLEEVFDNSATVAMGECVGLDFEIQDVRALKSDIQDALPVYLLIKAKRLDNDQPVILNTGAGRAMAQLWRAKELGGLPHKVRIVEVGKAKPGQSAPIGIASVEADYK